MSRGWVYKSGDNWVVCDVCGKQIRASQTKQRWDGFLVCTSDWEPRHPQDFLRARLDRISAEVIRSEPADEFVDVDYIAIYVADGYVANDYIEDLDI